MSSLKEGEGVALPRAGQRNGQIFVVKLTTIAKHTVGME